MGSADLVVAGVSCLAASVLFVAGIDKLVAPDRLASALRGALARLGRSVTGTSIRIAAALEVATAVSLNIGGLRVPAAICLGVLGLAFAVAGAGGWLHKSAEACGCLGRYGTHPLGMRNVAAGIAFLAVAVVHARPALVGSQAQLAFLGSMSATVLASLALVMVLNRSIIREFTRAVDAGR